MAGALVQPRSYHDLGDRCVREVLHVPPARGAADQLPPHICDRKRAAIDEEKDKASVGPYLFLIIW